MDDLLRWMVTTDEISMLEAEWESCQARANYLKVRLDSFRAERAEIEERMGLREAQQRARTAAMEMLQSSPEPLYVPPKE